MTNCYICLTEDYKPTTELKNSSYLYVTQQNATVGDAPMKYGYYYRDKQSGNWVDIFEECRLLDEKKEKLNEIVQTLAYKNLIG